MPFELPALPYAADALEPYYSANTISFHHGKHHAAYVNNLNGLIEGTDLADKPLEEIIQTAAGDPAKAGLFNNAAQIWNHTFFWNSMKPGGGGTPTGELTDRIVSSFGSLENCADEFKKAAATRFGSGWAWVVVDGGDLKVVTTANAETPITQGMTPLITLDVWEHAYYLDYQNRRPDFIQTFVEHLVNLDFAAENLAKAG
jgi:superoxide dismutase, Fe-Mn family